MSAFSGRLCCLLAAAILLAASAPARANPAAFTGEWRNLDADTRGLTKLDVRIDRGTFIVRAWGKCVPQDCDWGRARAVPYAQGASENLWDTLRALSAEFSDPAGSTLLVMRPASGGRLEVEALRRFAAGDRRSNYHSVYSMARPSAMPGVGVIRGLGPMEVLQSASLQGQPAARAQRRILPDGTIEIEYADRTVRHLPDGGVETQYRDGRHEPPRHFRIQVAPVRPVALPGDPIAVEWLNRHNDALLSVMGALVGGEEHVHNYLQFEAGLASLYERIDTRTRFIQRLAAE